MRGYFAASEEIAFRMAARGIATENIFVTGIPVMPAFSRRLDRAECARELGIDPDKTTLLVMTGGAGLTGGAAMIERLAARQAIFRSSLSPVETSDCWPITANWPRRIPGGFIRSVSRRRSSGSWPALTSR